MILFAAASLKPSFCTAHASLTVPDHWGGGGGENKDAGYEVVKSLSTKQRILTPAQEDHGR